VFQIPEKADPVELMAAMEAMAPAFRENMHGQVRAKFLLQITSCIK
jgi:hypothetical protein